MKRGLIADRADATALLLGLLKDLRSGRGHWRDIVLSGRKNSLPIAPEFFIDVNQAVFYKLVTVNNRDVCVDIAACSGVISASLAEEYKTVYALESVDEWVEFMDFRFKQDGIGNAKVLKARLPSLPIKNETADLIIAHDLPRDGWRIDGRKNPRTAFLDILLEARRCLKYGGKIAMAARNSWNMRSLGEGARKRSYAYSYWQYVKLFEKAGLKSIRTYLSYPEHNLPRQIYSMDRQPLSDFYNIYQADNRFNKMIKKFSDLFNKRYIPAFFEKSFYIVGQKQ